MAKTKAKSLPAAGDTETRNKLLARVIMNPVTPHAALTQGLLSEISGGVLDQSEVRESLFDEVRAIKAGDLGSLERMLYAQSVTLNAVFVDMVRRSSANFGQHLGAMEVYMRLALKAQGQCRATLETLAAIKNPPVVYARQANFAAGPQQVNNGAIPHAAKNENAPNELLEGRHGKGERLDGGTASEAIGSDSALAAVGTINRAAKR
jgi:hypothetical protein